jgi:hypothetical protein
MRKPRILVLSFSDLATDPRVNRQLRLLAPDFEVTAAGFKDPEIPGVEFLFLPGKVKPRHRRLAAATRLLLAKYEAYYWRIDSAAAARTLLRGRSFDLIIANDTNTWPLAAAVRGSARLLFDAHEYSPRELEDVLWWRIFYQSYQRYLCREYLPRADGVLTVCPGIAAEFHKDFGVMPKVVMNTPRRSDAPPAARSEGDQRIRIIHHGGAIRSRHITSMIEAMDHLDDRFSLDLMLTPQDPKYLALIAEQVRNHPRVKLRPAVPMLRITEEIRDYDVGLFLLRPVNFNYRHALPNKFFEFIQARLAVAIGPSPEMAALVRRFDCGVVAPDFEPESLARELRALTPETLQRFRRNSHAAADVLCWEHELVVLRSEVNRLLSLGAYTGGSATA